MPMAFNPVTGLLNTASYPTTPANETVARQQFMDLFYQLRDYINKENPNVLFNPSGRLGLSGWSVNNSGGSTWGVAFGGAGEGGMFSCGSVTSGTPVLASTKTPMGASQQITLSLEMFAVGVTAGIQHADVQCYDVNNVLLSGGIVLNATSGQGWNKYTGSFTTPANTNYVVVRIFGDSGFTTTSSFWRKIKLESGSVATIFSDDNTLNTQQYGIALGLMQSISGGYKQETVSSVSGTTPATTGVQKIGTFTFPTAFSVAPAVFPVINSGMGQCTSLGTFNITATSFDLYGNVATINSAITFSYIAIGT